MRTEKGHEKTFEEKELGLMGPVSELISPIGPIRPISPISPSSLTSHDLHSPVKIHSQYTCQFSQP